MAAAIQNMHRLHEVYLGHVKTATLYITICVSTQNTHDTLKLSKKGKTKYASVVNMLITHINTNKISQNTNKYNNRII